MMYRKLMQTASTSFAVGGEPDTRKILPRIGLRRVGDASIYAAWLRPWLEFRTRPSTGDPFCACCTPERSHELHLPHDCESAFNPRFFLYDNHPGLAAARTLGES